MKTSLKIESDLSSGLITEVSRIVGEQTGVQFGPKQWPMITSRVSRRISELGFSTETEYLAYFRANLMSETRALISLLTTHHSYFFREYGHFEYLANGALSKVVENAKKRGQTKIRVWSAAASRGQEAYSLSMFLSHHLKKIAPTMDYEIFGSDVCEESVAFARSGVYAWNDVKGIPALYLADHCSRGTGAISRFAKIKAPIKSKCSFKVLNLTRFNEYPEGQKFDLIFCRNVFIYFSTEQTKACVSALMRNLAEGGLLFLGMTESIAGNDLPLSTVGPSIYQAATQAGGKSSLALVLSQRPQKPLRIFCVDDSPVILSLLKRILTAKDGFEVVGTAFNGKEAEEKIKAQPVDVVTMDIHMPEMNGIEYLQKHQSRSHPPVVIISSVSRDDAPLAIRALELGAIDYIEKPELGSLGTSGDEIRSKLLNAFRAKTESASTRNLELEKSFAESDIPASKTDATLALFAGLGDRQKLASLFSELRSRPLPACVVFFEGARSILPEFTVQLANDVRGINVEVFDPSSRKELKPGRIYLAEFRSAFESIRALRSPGDFCALVFGEVSQSCSGKIRQWNPGCLLLEERIGEPTLSRKSLLETAKDVVPCTSFAYLTRNHLRRVAHD